jgi:hypothetical protein
MLKIDSQNYFADGIAELSEQMANAKDSKRYQEFEYTIYPEFNLKGEIINYSDETEIKLPKIPEAYLESVVNVLGQKNYNYSVKNEDLLYNYDASENELCLKTERETDMKHIVREGLEDFGNFEDAEFKYINTDSEGNTMSSIMKGDLIKEISYKDFHYKDTMNSEEIEKELDKLKYNEVAVLNGKWAYDRLEQTPDTENRNLINALEKVEGNKAAELFLYDYAGDQTLQFIDIPENYTAKELAQSIRWWIDEEPDIIFNIKPGQEKIIPELFKHGKELNEVQNINFTLDRPEEEVFYLNRYGATVMLFDEKERNIEECYEILKSRKSEMNLSKVLDFDIYNGDHCIVKDDGEFVIEIYPSEAPSFETLKKAQNISKDAGKIIRIEDNKGDVLKVDGDTLHLWISSKKMDESSLKNFIKENKFDKLFSVVKSRGKLIYDNEAKKEDVKNKSKAR